MAAKIGVVAFPFGAPGAILANRRVGRVATKKSREFKAVVFTNLNVWVDSDIEVQYARGRVSHPPSTFRIAWGAAQWARRQGFGELWVVAAKPLIPRCVRDIKYALRQLGAQHIELRVCPEIEEFPEEEWFCPDSTQIQTCFRKDWERRERILRHMPMWIYKLVAS